MGGLSKKRLPALLLLLLLQDGIRTNALTFDASEEGKRVERASATPQRPQGLKRSHQFIARSIIA
jgi:hypothetical protein